MSRVVLTLVSPNRLETVNISTLLPSIWVASVLGRTEPRDLFDIPYLLTQRELDLASVSFRLEEKVISKDLEVAELKEVLERKQESLGRLWEPRLQGQLLDELPHLEVVIREANRLLRQEGII